MVIYMGAQVGLKPNEIFDLTFSELNVYLQGLTRNIDDKYVMDVRMNHSLAHFIALASQGKLKDVEYYLPKKHVENKEYTVQKSREISKTIDRLRGERNGS